MGPGGGGAGEAREPASGKEEEALKRNTDCVYFLASPLTCKKGSECEYRHSERARLNPRECWFWINGNCLNSKCAFRHPPLDGLCGPPGTTSGTSSMAPQTLSSQLPSAQGPAAHNMKKQGVPCYYFQKGLCMKGTWCPFVHGPPSASPSIVPIPRKGSLDADGAPQMVKDPAGLQNVTVSSKRSLKSAVDIPVEALAPSSANQVSMAKAVRGYDHTPTGALEHPLPRDTQRALEPIEAVDSGDTLAAVGSPNGGTWHDNGSNGGRENDEFLGESSPGFDVLVDGDIEDGAATYFEDDHGGRFVGDGIDMDHSDDFDYRSRDYEIAEMDRYDRMKEYDPFDRFQCDPDRQLTEAYNINVTDESYAYGTAMRRKRSPEEMDGSDLRHQLLKHRRTANGSRSTAFSGNHREPHRTKDRRAAEQDPRRSSSRDGRHGSLSRRLQGRLGLPRRPSPDRPESLQPRREQNWRSHRDFSPMPRTKDPQARHRERTKGRQGGGGFVVSPSSSGGKPSMDFVGPKSLAEIKAAARAPKTFGEYPIGTGDSDAHGDEIARSYGGSLLFDDPKPLSVILENKNAARLPAVESLPGAKDDSAANKMGDEELESWVDQKDGVSYYDEAEDEDMKAEGRGIAGIDDEEALEEFDDDDFATKVGAILS